MKKAAPTARDGIRSVSYTHLSATARNVVKDLIQGHPQIAFYYLQGNHDEGSFTSSLSELPENLHLFGNNWTSYELSGTENTSGKGVAVTGVELTPENSGSIYNTLSLDVDQCNIVVLHGQESEYSARAVSYTHLCRNKVYEVAEQVGYRDIAHFSSSFKRIVGVTPSEYQDRSLKR